MIDIDRSWLKCGPVGKGAFFGDDRNMKETFKCFVYDEEVTVVDGVCQEDCSIEECNLNKENQPVNEVIKENSGSEDQ